ncbi:hypothetical protein R6Q59_024394 [Mikania micrantha]
MTENVSKGVYLTVAHGRPSFFGWSSTCHMEGTIFTIAPDFNGTCAGAPRMPMLPPGGPGVVPAATCSMYKARWRSNAKLLDAHVSARSVGSRWKACGCSWAAELATTSSSYAITDLSYWFFNSSTTLYLAMNYHLQDVMMMRA